MHKLMELLEDMGATDVIWKNEETVLEFVFDGRKAYIAIEGVSVEVVTEVNHE